MAIIRSVKQQSKKFKIIRDTREQKGKGWIFRASTNCDGMEIEKLDVGDYTVKGYEDVLMIERKTLGDLWNTLGNVESYKRFLREMERAKNHKMKYIIIEATLAELDRGYYWYVRGKKTKSKISPKNIHAKLISLQVKHNVHVVFAGRIDKARSYARLLMDKIFRYTQDGTL